MSGSQALDSFLDKWRARWPEWAVAEVFVPPGQRARAVAWFALLQELDDILNVQGDPLPADAKLGWWATELCDWQAHRSRHPLGRLLEPADAPWQRLADALPALVDARARASDGDAALAALAGFAGAAAAVEAALLEAPPAVAPALAAQVLASRLAEAGLDAVPQSLQPATDGADAREQARRAWAGWLLDAWPARAGGALPRRVWSALARERLRSFAAARPPGRGGRPMRTLWQAWRAARRRS
ncbi:phytoene/squalene synthase family protein [Pseudoxanthomonas broegbernensis]|uniref:Phytoene/squalene synthase family protein n=1 Tax=Pseudoxanthomonas broegbernensis TaxID=83619 RepID=A0A7V8K8F4_9GAMM|nr:phytoene/squalene synthase family protein [Pseudoxanthomonas broegbernensis]KAF1687661.1 phytoene/squalene synthase family protein [Pseudoxanthomonas broegbernensis]MBB6064687.1 phytoene/squalene synthetase [Pseudoxanthomonas broegbernensis]